MAVAAVQADDHVPFTDKDLETEESMWNLYERWRAVYASSSSSSGDLADKVSRFEVFKEGMTTIRGLSLGVNLGSGGNIGRSWVGQT